MPDTIAALEKQLSVASDTKEKVDLRIKLAMELRFQDLPRAVAICEDAVEMASLVTANGRIEYEEGAAESFYTLGNLCLQSSDYNQAFTHFSSAMELFQKLEKPIQYAKTINSMGAGHYYLGGYVEALDYYLKALSIFRDTQQRIDEAAVLNNVGLIHLSANEILRSLDYFEQCLQICVQNGIKSTQAEALDNISSAYLRLDDYDNALDFGLQSVELYETLGVLDGQAEALNSLGDVYAAQRNHNEALDRYHKSFEISKSIGNRYEMVRALQKIGESYRNQDLFDQVLSVLHQALVIAQEIGARQLQYECHHTLAETYKQLGDFKRALAHYEEYSLYKEAIFNQEADQRLKQLEVAHQVETARKEAEISQLRYGDLQKEIFAREQLIDDLNAFAHMVAHDLKNPLQNLNLSAYYLTKKLSDADPQIIGAVEAVQQTGKKMN